MFGPFEFSVRWKRRGRRGARSAFCGCRWSRCSRGRPARVLAIGASTGRLATEIETAGVSGETHRGSQHEACRSGNGPRATRNEQREEDQRGPKRPRGTRTSRRPHRSAANMALASISTTLLVY